jgi:F0F1-type ATP synthase assembly protein I
VAGANESLQENLDRTEPVIFASYGVTGAVLVLGMAGYLLDRWLGTHPWCLLAGLVAGIGIGLSALVTAVRRS